MQLHTLKPRVSNVFTKRQSEQIQNLNLEKKALQFKKSKTIQFQYDIMNINSLYGKNLEFKNISNEIVYYKIRCTNPDNYQVQPSQGQLNSKQSIAIKIKLILDQIQLHNIGRYQMDQFSVGWAFISRQQQQNNRKPKLKEYHYMSVVIKASIITNQTAKRKLQIQKIKTQQYQTITKKNKQTILEIENKIEEIKHQSHKIISKTTIALIGVMMFMVSFLIT